MENIFFQTSLIAAFVAGIVALFAPCCITFLLPAYLGSVFKEKEKVVMMTLVFGVGGDVGEGEGVVLTITLPPLGK